MLYPNFTQEQYASAYWRSNNYGLVRNYIAEIYYEYSKIKGKIFNIDTEQHIHHISFDTYWIKVTGLDLREDIYKYRDKELRQQMNIPAAWLFSDNIEKLLYDTIMKEYNEYLIRTLEC